MQELHTKRKISLQKFHEHPFFINCKNLCRYRHTLSNILDNETFATPLEDIMLDNDFLQMTSNELKFDLDFNLDEIFDQTDFSTQEVSAIAKEIEKVR